MCLALLMAVPHGLLAATGDCGQPGSSGSTASASDALATLKSAVGSPSPCDAKPCVCDVNGDGTTTSSDALRILRVAVGQQVQLECDCPCGGDPACNDAPQDADEEFTWSEGENDTDAFAIELLANASDPDGDDLHILSLDDATLTSLTDYGAFSLETDGFAGRFAWTNDGDQAYPLQFAIEPDTGIAAFTLDSALFYGLRTDEWVELRLDYTVSDGFGTDMSHLTFRIEGEDSAPVVRTFTTFFTSSQVNDGLAALRLEVLAENFFDPDFEDQVEFHSIDSVHVEEYGAEPALAIAPLDEFTFEVLHGVDVVAVLTYIPWGGFTIESSDSGFWSNLGADQAVEIEVRFLVYDKSGLFGHGTLRFWINGEASPLRAGRRR